MLNYTLPRFYGCIRTSGRLAAVHAIRESHQAGAHFGYSDPVTEMTLPGNLAKRFPGKALPWDHEKMRMTNLEEANAWVRRPYRKGWSL